MLVFNNVFPLLPDYFPLPGFALRLFQTVSQFMGPDDAHCACFSVMFRHLNTSKSEPTRTHTNNATDEHNVSRSIRWVAALAVPVAPSCCQKRVLPVATGVAGRSLVVSASGWSSMTINSSPGTSGLETRVTRDSGMQCVHTQHAGKTKCIS